MKCPKCGFNNVDWAESCKKCNGNLNPLYTRLSTEVFPETSRREPPAAPPPEPQAADLSVQLQSSVSSNVQDEGAQVTPPALQEPEELKEPYIPTPFRPRVDQDDLPSPPDAEVSEVESENAQPVALQNSGGHESGAIPGTSTPIPQPHLPGEEEVVLEDDQFDVEQYGELRDPEDYEDIVDERGLVSYDLAGFGSRVAAVVIDIIVICFITAITIYVAFMAAGKNLIPEQAFEISIPIFLLVFLLYFIVLIGYNGKTIGKTILKIRVVRDTGDQVGLGRSILRSVSFMILGLFSVLALIDSNNQTLHDKIAKTYVVSE